MTTQNQRGKKRGQSRGAAVREELARRKKDSLRHMQVGAEYLALEQIKTVDVPTKLYFESASGSIIKDADGNSYIDMIMGFGAHVLGHRPPAIETAVKEQMEKGWHFGLNNTLQGHHAQKLAQLGKGGQSKILYCGSGSEATMYACRVARAYTGRTRIAVFDGSYHGSHDYALVKADMASDPKRPDSTIFGAGVPRVLKTETMLVLPFRDETAFDIIRREGNDIAAILVQPVQNNLPRLDSRWFLEELRRVCHETGTALIFDEVVTGLRIGYRGAQGYFDVAPDLTAYGKAIGGGLPVGALAGRPEIMQLFPKSNSEGGVFSSGTFNANPLTMAAGLAALQFLEEHQDTVYPQLASRAERLRERVNAFAEERQLAVRMMNAGSMMYLGFERSIPNNAWGRPAANPVANDDFFLHMLSQGVLMPASRMVLISSEHTDEQMDVVGDAVVNSITALQEDGLL
jgi:glutamate-1-semialdehyde-2,1-aminomutase